MAVVRYAEARHVGLLLAVIASLTIAGTGCTREATSEEMPAKEVSATSSGTGNAKHAALSDVSSWAFAIGYDTSDPAAVERLADYDLVVVDGEDTTETVIAGLQDVGTLVLGYVNVGTLEPDRPWTRPLSDYRLDDVPEWNEVYLDVSMPSAGQLVLDWVVKPSIAKGFDGLFLDNTDMVETHPEQAEGMTRLVSAIRRQLGEDGLLFTQNGADVIEPILPYLDGWNREDVTWTYDFDAEKYRQVSAAEHEDALGELETMAAAGLFTTATDYTDGDKAAGRTCVDAAGAVGALPFVSDIWLTRLDGP